MQIAVWSDIGVPQIFFGVHLRRSNCILFSMAFDSIPENLDLGYCSQKQYVEMHFILAEANRFGRDYTCKKLWCRLVFKLFVPFKFLLFVASRASWLVAEDVLSSCCCFIGFNLLIWSRLFGVRV